MTGQVPTHVAIIMDGNGRWAEKRNLSRSEGHKKGVETLQNVAYFLKDKGVSVVTVFAFSTENWKRSADEVNGLFMLVEQFNEELHDISIRFIGNIAALPLSTQNSISKVTALTQNNSGFVLNIALNYGGKDDIVRAVNKAVEQKIIVTEQSFAAMLDTSGLPDVDLLIRTGGDKRLSNFMLYQCAYAELAFTDKFWPDTTDDDISQILENYCNRTRKFGGYQGETC